jgi:nitrate reductase alpha subunit
MDRRDFLRWMGAGAGVAATELGLPLRLLAAADPDQNPLAGSVTRDWEKIYRDQYTYDRSFDWVCSPNDTHACRVRAYVRNGIVTRLGNTYDYQTYADIYGNKATANWNPRQCAKGYTFHRVLYGPYRLKHPIVRKGWKAWADAGFPELTPELKSKYLFDRRGEDEFIQISWEDVFHNIAKALVAIADRYSGERGKERLLAQGYQPEMVAATGGAGTRCVKMRGGMGLLGVIGKYGMYRLNNSLAILDTIIRRVSPQDAKGGRNWSNYTWHGDQAPGHPWVHGLQASDCDFNDLRFSKLIIMDGKNLVENKLTDSHWFIETMERGARVRAALHQGGLLDPHPSPDRRRPLAGDHPADDRQHMVRRALRQGLHRLPPAGAHRHSEAPAGPRGISRLPHDAVARRPLRENPGAHPRAARHARRLRHLG